MTMVSDHVEGHRWGQGTCVSKSQQCTNSNVTKLPKSQGSACYKVSEL